jgi:hypothetical protein
VRGTSSTVADPDRIRKIERFAQLCEMARPLGLTIDREFPSWTETPDSARSHQGASGAEQPIAGSPR